MRKEVVATFIFYHGDGSGISCSRFRLYGSGETGRNKAEKRITAYWRRNTKKKQRNGAKAEATESPCTESWEP